MASKLDLLLIYGHLYYTIPANATHLLDILGKYSYSLLQN